MRQLMHSFKGEMPPQAVLDGVRNGQIASFCLFRGINGDSPVHMRALTDALYRAAQEGNQPPPLIGTDQEGGNLIAITGGATELPGNMALGATRSVELAEQAGQVLGRELLAMGLNLNFAPCLDVNINPSNPALGVRSFGDDPILVGELGAALIRGMQGEGVMSSAKHFPGLGDSAHDTHFESTKVNHPLSRLEQVELAPFGAAIREGVATIMNGHGIFPALDAQLPATLSPAVIRYLRETMGFQGLILTDAMDMHAVSRYGHQESVQAALHAGVDLALLGHIPDQIKLMESLAGKENPTALHRLESLQARLRTDRPPFEIIGCETHQKIAQTIADAAVTLVRGAEHLPLRPSPETRIAVITPIPENLTPADTSSSVDITLAEMIRKRHPRTDAYQLRRHASDGEISTILNAVKGADVVIVGTIAADQDQSQAGLVNTLQREGKQPLVVAMRTPYDLSVFPQIGTYLCCYSIRPVAMEAAARVIFGEITAKGILPCRIPGVAV